MNKHLDLYLTIMATKYHDTENVRPKVQNIYTGIEIVAYLLQKFLTWGVKEMAQWLSILATFE